MYLKPADALLSDSNEELINCYRQVRDKPRELIEKLTVYREKHDKYGKDFYLEQRSLIPEEMDALDWAARMVYLNKTCYNGLYRVNSSGRFNVPFGRYKNPSIFDPENILAVSAALRGVDVNIEVMDFRKITDKASSNDFIYFDPPYHPLSATSNFTDYSKASFGEKEQRELRDEFRRLSEMGCFVMLSNSDTQLINDLYGDYEIIKITTPRYINSKGEGRKEILELLVRNFNDSGIVQMEKKGGANSRKRAEGKNKFWGAWEKIFKERIDPKNSITEIRADEIKNITGFEPRLLAKFDTRESLPPILRKNNLFILPKTNGVYCVVSGDGYHDLEETEGREEEFVSTLPFSLESSSYGISEMGYLDYSFNSGLISRFTGVENLYLTNRGRKYSPEFEFMIGEVNFPPVASVQVEVDAGYEGPEDIIIIEAKIGPVRSFHVRQLYYPYRFWKKIIPEKKVRPVFLVYEPKKKSYIIYEYRFNEPDDYSSIELVKAGRYRITSKISKENPLNELFFDKEKASTKQTKDKTVYTPQANDINKIIALPFLISQGMYTPGSIAEYFNFSLRQASYYLETCCNLDLVESRSGKFRLTTRGEDFTSLSPDKRNIFLGKRIMELSIFRKILSRLYEEKELTWGRIAEIIRANSNLSGVTPHRRTSTLKSWFWWLYSVLGLIKVGKDSIFI